MGWCKQVANLRIHYSRKVKELTDKLEEAAKPVEVISRSKANTDNMCPPTRVATARLQPVNFSLDGFELFFHMVGNKYIGMD